MNPYKNRGNWVDCPVHGAYRELNQVDVFDYFLDVDKSEIRKLKDDEATRCRKCNPVLVVKSANCKSCGNEILCEINYDDMIPEECPHCHQSRDILLFGNNSSASIVKSHGAGWQRGLSGDFKNMMKHFKKRHNNGQNNIPDY